MENEILSAWIKEQTEARIYDVGKAFFEQGAAWAIEVAAAPEKAKPAAEAFRELWDETYGLDNRPRDS